jgi:hypothetical protein
LLTPHGIAERMLLTSRFLRRKIQEYEALKAEIERFRVEVEDNGNPSLSKASR